MELDPGYLDVAVGRWAGATGKQAILDGTNETFADRIMQLLKGR